MGRVKLPKSYAAREFDLQSLWPMVSPRELVCTWISSATHTVMLMHLYALLKYGVSEVKCLVLKAAKE